MHMLSVGTEKNLGSFHSADYVTPSRKDGQQFPGCPLKRTLKTASAA
ncbi:hypothetical protein BSY240_1341 [Agrobacterium sp. RAC06]|jgi:hypothetical protein|nr:hypothetical protein BSY240_1341 [Agrobacterium sp. RAC06]